MQQRDDIEAKYEGIYAAVEHECRKFLSLSDLSSEENYERLKVITVGVWHVMALTSPPRTPQEVAACINDYLAMKTTWTVNGAVFEGTQREYRRAQDAHFARKIADYAAGCDLVVDLGCGWGHRMIDVHRAGIDAQFYGGDRSEHSRALTNLSSELFPRMRAQWFKFDFLRPDFSAIEGDFRKVCVFSIAAIEQVQRLGNALFDALTSRFQDVTGVHFEPVSPQIEPSMTSLRKLLASTRYNEDLMEVLRGHPRVSILEQDAMSFGSSSAKPSALVTWRSRRPD